MIDTNDSEQKERDRKGKRQRRREKKSRKRILESRIELEHLKSHYNYRLKKIFFFC